MRSFLVAALVLLAATSAQGMTLVPQPVSVRPAACGGRELPLDHALRVEDTLDRGGFELLRERWTGLGIPAPVLVPAGAAGRAEVVRRSTAGLRSDQDSKAYALAVDARGASIRSASPEAEFDGLMTLAQLPERRLGRWVLPCVRIDDAPSMPMRIVSDDVSRGPFPTPEYARERIRTLASLKINGWSPYMEQVVADPRSPFVAWPNGWTPAQLHELAVYARRYHVALIPEQQTFAHMHESLKWERLAPLAELPHGYLLAESDPATYAYLEPLVKSVYDAVKPVALFHLGADEPIDLGRGRTPRTAQAFADHVKRVASWLPDGTLPMIWDDAMQQDHALFALVPKNVVVVAFHYGVEKSYKPFIDPIADAGFRQMIAPSAANFNEIYPDLATSYANVGRFAADARGVHGMLGMFMTVWHDDGETLFEATWPAVAYAAATAWQKTPVDEGSWHRTFAHAFFGSDDPRYAADLDALAAIRPLIRTTPSDPPGYLFWRDPFDPRVQARARTIDLAGVRNRAETVLTHVMNARPPLHPGALAAMRLGALRYDQLARRLQIGKEARDDYDDARAHAATPGQSQVYRSLGVAKYLCWELRDGLAFIAPVYAAAWRHESTEPGLARMQAHYRVGEDDAQRCADRIDGVMREDYLRKGTVPAWDEVFPSSR